MFILISNHGLSEKEAILFTKVFYAILQTASFDIHHIVVHPQNLRDHGGLCVKQP